MKKLINGIVEFRNKNQKNYKASLDRLTVGQTPDTLFIACSDSRVVPNTFASTNPGDLFVLRNVGNLIPPCSKHDLSENNESESAAIDFSILSLNITDIIICGHSECAAMQMLVRNRHNVQIPNLKNWLRHGDKAVDQLKSGTVLDTNLSEHNQLSQLNVLLQIEHVKSYATVKSRIAEGRLTIHGWWFDISKADVYAYEEEIKKFVLIDETEAARLLERLKKL